METALRGFYFFQIFCRKKKISKRGIFFRYLWNAFSNYKKEIFLKWFSQKQCSDFLHFNRVRLFAHHSETIGAFIIRLDSLLPVLLLDFGVKAQCSSHLLLTPLNPETFPHSPSNHNPSPVNELTFNLLVSP